MKGRKSEYKFSKEFGDIENNRLESLYRDIERLKLAHEGEELIECDMEPIIYDDGDFDVTTGTNLYFRVFLDRFELWEWKLGGEKEHIHMLTF